MNLPNGIGERIGAAAGDGLGASALLIDRLLAPVLRLPGNREDGHRLGIPSRNQVITADVFAVDPLVFPGGNIGTLAAAGVCNDLMASGAHITEVALGIYASAHLEVAVLQGCLESFSSAVRAQGASVVCGDTKVHLQHQPELLLFVTALGAARSQRRFDLADAQPDDVIIVTGALGDHAIAVLSAREGLGFESVVSSDARSLNAPVEELIDKDLVHSLRDLTRGGLVAALWDASAATGLSWVVDEAAIPVRRPVRAAAEMLGLDPLALTNEGCMLITAPATAAAEVLAVLGSYAETADSIVIGTVRPGTDPPGPLLASQTGNVTSIPLPLGLGVSRLC